LTSGRRKGLETHLKRIAAKGIATDLACKDWREAFLGGKAAFEGKYRLFLGKEKFLAKNLVRLRKIKVQLRN